MVSCRNLPTFNDQSSSKWLPVDWDDPVAVVFTFHCTPALAGDKAIQWETGHHTSFIVTCILVTSHHVQGIYSGDRSIYHKEIDWCHLSPARSSILTIHCEIFHGLQIYAAAKVTVKYPVLPCNLYLMSQMKSCVLPGGPVGTRSSCML